VPSLPVIRSEQYPATDETQCVTVYIPSGDEYKALLAGLYSLAINPANYDEPDSAQVDGLTAIWDNAYSLIDWTGCIMPELIHPSVVDLFSVNGAVSGGVLSITTGSAQPFSIAYSDTTSYRYFTNTFYPASTDQHLKQMRYILRA